MFVNENVFSGDAVTSDHLKNQYGLVIGEEGVRRVGRIVELDDENREVNAALGSGARRKLGGLPPRRSFPCRPRRQRSATCWQAISMKLPRMR